MPVENASSGNIIIRGNVLPLAERVHVMGILNLTPDSFSDGGRYLHTDAALAHAMALIEQGADLIDVGAESSRPGAVSVPEDEERRRLLPLVRELCKRTSIPVSIDTTKAAIAEEALDAGATIINDISAFQFDPRMSSVVARSGAGAILMHMQGHPATMQQTASYTYVVQEVKEFLAQRLRMAQEAGISRDRILLDPGVGFGKNCEHNLTLLNQLDAFQALGRPLLVGVSRKAFIGKILDRAIDERLMGTAGAVAVAVMKGARVVRVHEVGPIRDVVKIVEAITRSS